MFKYIAIKNELKKIIDSHDAHYMLPSRNEIIREYKVSDITVRKALEELLREGLIYSHHGKGSFVAPKKKEFLEVYNIMQGTEQRHFKDKSGWYFPLVEELEMALEENEMEMTISFHKKKADMERQILERLMNKSPYGIIIYYSGHKENIPYYKNLLEINRNCVFVDRYIEEINSNYVGTDNILTAKLLAENISKSKSDKTYIIDFDWCNKTNVSIERQTGFIQGIDNKNYEIITTKKSYYDELDSVCDYIERDIKKYDNIGMLTMNSYMLSDIYSKIGNILMDRKVLNIGCFEKPDISLFDNTNLFWARQNIEQIAKSTVKIIKENKKDMEHILIPADIIFEKSEK